MERKKKRSSSAGRKIRPSLKILVFAIIILSCLVLFLSGNISFQADPRDLVIGALLNCMEAGTLGLPLEIWKTQMGRFRNQSTFQSLKNIYIRGGIQAFYQGYIPKLLEAASKGAVLLFTKDAINRTLYAAGVEHTFSGLVAGAGGGVCQTLVMGPCTYVVTAVVTGNKQKSSLLPIIFETYKNHGVYGFYQGSLPVALRQASNWASRQGFTDGARMLLRVWFHGSKDARLSKLQDVLCGTVAGVLSVWNQPFEVSRIEMQASAVAGKPKTMSQAMAQLVAEQGISGLYRGLVPRICLAVYQTMFMVVFSSFIAK